MSENAPTTFALAQRLVAGLVVIGGGAFGLILLRLGVGSVASLVLVTISLCVVFVLCQLILSKRFLRASQTGKLGKA